MLLQESHCRALQTSGPTPPTLSPSSRDHSEPQPPSAGICPPGTESREATVKEADVVLSGGPGPWPDDG